MVDYCENCGSKIIHYWHRLNKPLCSALVRCYMKKKFMPFSLKEVDLSHEQKCNFSKLKYWNLVEKNPVGWKVTEIGLSFIKGLSIPLKVKTYRDKVVEESEEYSVIGEIVEGYQFREDYLNENE